MPTECERSVTSPTATATTTTTTTIPLDNSDIAATTTATTHIDDEYMDDSNSGNSDNIMDKDMLNGEMSTSTGSSGSATNGHNGSSSSNGGRKTSITSPDPTAYVAKARVTRPTPPPPSYNPMQFVQIKPCNLYQTAQQQLKKAEEVKKIKEIKKEEPEDWQNNLDNWKSSRRKRVEHIIDRVVEVKKLELEEHDRSRRKSKTFSEMIEERGERAPRIGRAKLASLAVYNEDESNDLSDLGIGTSSASGKSSLSEDYDNNSVMSDNADLDKVIYDNNHLQSSTTREYISSPGYDTSSSTAPASSPDPCEYTYEGAIQDYKQRVSRATCGGSTGFKLSQNQPKTLTTTTATTLKESTPERGVGTTEIYAARRGSKIEERLIGFEVNSPNDSQDVLLEKNKVDLPKIDISKRKEMFEAANNEPLKSQGNMISNGGVPKVTLRERFKIDAEAQLPAAATKKEVKRLSGDISSVKNRLQNLEQQQNIVNSANASTSKLVDIPVPPLKERLSSLQNAATKEEVKKPPVVLVDARQLEIMKDEDETAKQRIKQSQEAQPPPHPVVELKVLEVDRDDSGIHTSDDVDEEQQQLTQEQQLNEAIAALALEEKQLEEAANAVNLIEAEFAELSSQAAAPAAATTTTNEMEFSINEALELALEAIDKETTITKTTTTKISKELPTKTTNDVSVAKCNNNSSNSNNNNQNATATNNQINNFNKQQIDKLNETELKIEEISLVPILTQADTEELIIQNEPIYENISATSTAPVDVEVKIIPNNLNKIKYNNNNNKSNNKNNNNNNKNSIKNINNNNNNNKPLVDITNSLATSYAATAAEMLQETSNHHKIETSNTLEQQHHQPVTTQISTTTMSAMADDEPYYQVPKSSEPYYDAPKHLRPIPLYENIEIFYNGLENATLAVNSGSAGKMEPPKEKPPPPPIDSPPALDDLDEHEIGGLDNWSSDNTYETISNRCLTNGNDPHPSPPIKRMNSTKRIKKELRNKRSSFLGIEGTTDDDLDSYLELTVAPPPDMAQLLQEERRLEKQLYMKAGLCDSSDTGESRDSGVSENHSRQSSEPYTNSSEEADRNDESPLSLNTSSSLNHKPDELIYQNETQLLVAAAQTPLLQTVKGNSAESWTESATAAAAATKSLTEATATANAKMHSIEEKIREQEEVLRVERELLQLEQEELKRQRENLMLRENLARRELQHGAKMLMSANRQSLQDLNGAGSGGNTVQHVMPQQQTSQQQQQQQMHQHQQAQPQQQIYANVPNLQQQYYQVETDYRKSMSDLNEFSKRLMLPPTAAPLPPTKPMRAVHVAPHADVDYAARQRHSLNTQSYGGSLVKIAGTTTPMVAQRQSTGSGGGGAIYSNYQQQQHHQSAQNLATVATATTNGHNAAHTNMTRNTLHALSATPKPKYTDGWVQVQNRKSYDSNLSNDPAWLSAYQQKRKSVPESYLYNNNVGSNHWLIQEAEQRRLAEQQQQQQHRRSLSTANTGIVQQQNVINGANKSGGKPLPDSIIQTLTERVQSKGIGERKRFDNYSNNIDKSPLHANNVVSYHLQQQQQQQQQLHPSAAPRHANDLSNHSHNKSSTTTSHSTTTPAAAQQDKVLSVSGKKKCSHCGDELGRGAAMIIESLLLFYHINCFKCCVCHVQLGDGLNGTDVRVRNHKLHCQNCYSSDDGIKFSCV